MLYSHPFQHTALSKRADKKASDGFLSVRSENRRILPELAGTKAKGSITVHNANVLGDLFDDSTISWSNRLRPHIFTVQAVALEDVTVFKFRMQHAAGDAVGMVFIEYRKIWMTAKSKCRPLQSGGCFLRRIEWRRPQPLNQSHSGVQSCNQRQNWIQVEVAFATITAPNAASSRLVRCLHFRQALPRENAGKQVENRTQERNAMADYPLLKRNNRDVARYRKRTWGQSIQILSPCILDSPGTRLYRFTGPKNH